MILRGQFSFRCLLQSAAKRWPVSQRSCYIKIGPPIITSCRCLHYTYKSFPSRTWMSEHEASCINIPFLKTFENYLATGMQFYYKKSPNHFLSKCFYPVVLSKSIAKLLKRSFLTILYAPFCLTRRVRVYTFCAQMEEVYLFRIMKKFIFSAWRHLYMPQNLIFSVKIGEDSYRIHSFSHMHWISCVKLSISSFLYISHLTGLSLLISKVSFFQNYLSVLKLSQKCQKHFGLLLDLRIAFQKRIQS